MIVICKIKLKPNLVSETTTVKNPETNAETETLEAQGLPSTETPSTLNGSTDTAASQETEISETVSQMENNSQVSDVLVCPLCYASFEVNEESQMHVNKHSNKPFKCQKCLKIFIVILFAATGLTDNCTTSTTVHNRVLFSSLQIQQFNPISQM